MEEWWTFEAVEQRLVEAINALWRSPDPEAGWMRSGTSALWRQVKPDFTEAATDDRPIVTCALTRAEVDRSNEALEWIERWVSGGITRRVMALGLIQLAKGGSQIEWTRVLADMGRDGAASTTDRLRKRYGRAILAIAEGLNRGASH